MRRWLTIGLVVAMTAVAAGCGGDDDSDASAATDWAGSVCTALTTWKDSLTSAASSLQGGSISVDALKSAVGDIEDATETLADDLEGLGRPDTEAGQQAQETVETLAGQLSDGADTIEDAVDDVSGVQGVVAAASTVTKTLTTMGTQVASAFSQLEGLEGSQELKDAFSEADSCSSFVSGS